MIEPKQSQLDMPRSNNKLEYNGNEMSFQCVSLRTFLKSEEIWIILLRFYEEDFLMRLCSNKHIKEISYLMLYMYETGNSYMVCI